MKTLAFFVILLCSAEVIANPLFEKADSKLGKSLHDKNCISCHASSFGGDGSGIYTREHTKVKTPKGLIAQVRNCNTMLGIKWFDDEELNVAAFLNKDYYHFE